MAEGLYVQRLFAEGDGGGSPGAAAACMDLAWYLGVNCDRLAPSKDDAIEIYRTALERHGVATDGWWDAQLGLCLIGHFLQMAWSKVAGGPTDVTMRLIGQKMSEGLHQPVLVELG